MTKGNNFSFSAVPGGIKLLDGISQVGINSQGCIKALLQSTALVFLWTDTVCILLCVLGYICMYFCVCVVCVFVCWEAVCGVGV